MSLEADTPRVPDDSQHISPHPLEYAAPQTSPDDCSTPRLLLSAPFMIIGYVLGLVGFVRFKFAGDFYEMGVGLSVLCVAAGLLFVSAWLQNTKPAVKQNDAHQADRR